MSWFLVRDRNDDEALAYIHFSWSSMNNESRGKNFRVGAVVVRLMLSVFLVKLKNAFDPIVRVYTVNTYSRISTVLQGRERSE